MPLAARSCARLCRDSRYARLGAPLRASRAGVCRGACCGGWRVGLCWRGGPPGRALSAHSPPLTDGGSARRARRRGRSSPPALRFAALAGPPRLRAAALSRSGGPAPCGRPRALPSPPVGGGRALPVAAAPAVVGGFWGRPLLVGPRRVPPFRAPRPCRVPALRLGCAALALPRRVGFGLRARPCGPVPAPPLGGLGRWPPGAAGAATGRLCRPPRGQGQGQGPGQAAARGPGGCAPRPPVAQGGPSARRVDNPENVDSLLDKSIQAWYSRRWKGKPPR